MQVSIIIVNYNTQQLIEKCLLSILLYTKDVNYETIIIDNNSSDNSVNFILTNFKWVKLIKSDKNIGFGKANNIGAAQAKGKYLFFLNPDTELLNNAIKEFYSFMENNPTIGAVGGILINKDSEIGNFSSYFPSPLKDIKYVFQKLFLHKTNVINLSTPIMVDSICGADIFIPKKLFNNLGGFDPTFFMYYEEVDLQKRMKNSHYKRVILPHIQIRHLDGGSFTNKGLSYKRFMMAQKSRSYYIAKYYTGIYIYIYKVILALLNIHLLFRKWPWKERIHAYLQIFK